MDSTYILKSFEIFDVTLYVLKNQVFLNQLHQFDDFKLTQVFQFGMEGVICQTNCEGRMFRVWGWPEFGIHLNFFSCFGTHPKINNVQPYLYNNAEKPLKHVLSLVTSWGKRVVVCMALSRTDNQNNLFMFDRFSGSTDNLPQKFCQSLFSNYICHPPGFSSN